MVEQPKNNISELQIEKFLAPSTFQCKMKLQDKIVSWPQYLRKQLRFITKIEMATSVGDLKTSRSIFGRQFRNFETHDAKIAISLKKIKQNLNFRKVHLEEQMCRKDDQFFCGRQIAYIIFQHFRVTEPHDAIRDFNARFRLSLRGDGVHGFDTRWDAVLLLVRQVPSDTQDANTRI